MAENGGLNVNDVLNKLRKIHAQDENGKYFGVNVFDEEEPV